VVALGLLVDFLASGVASGRNDGRNRIARLVVDYNVGVGLLRNIRSSTRTELALDGVFDHAKTERLVEAVGLAPVWQEVEV
jgi:hypothetical protein